MLNDIRYALRSLKHHPGFTLAAVAALALGIGANTAIFSVVNAVLLRPLPFPEPEELVVLWERNQELERERDPVAAPSFLDWRDASRTVPDMAAWMYWSYTLTGGEEPIQVTTPRVSANLFDVLGVDAALGGTFAAEHEQPGRHRVVVLSHGFWLSRFGGDSGVVGRAVLLDGDPYTILGVMPAAFRFPDNDRVAMWVPLAFTDDERQSRRRRQFSVIGRLADGVTVEQARGELDGIAAGIAAASPATNSGWGVTIQPASDLLLEANGHLVILLGAVTFVLLIACANVASLLLSRAADRDREMAIRAALGAGRGRIVGQFMIESVLLGVLGGAVGLVFAFWGIDLVLALNPGDLPGWNTVRVDRVVLAFTGGVSLLTALLAGLAPALQVSRAAQSDALKEAVGRTTGGRRRARMRSAIVVAEVALAVVLLVGAGLLINSFLRLTSRSPGFRTERLLAANLFLADTRYPEDHRQIGFFTDLLERVEALPGVVDVGAASALPLNAVGGADFDLPIAIEGQEPPPPGQEPEVDFRVVTTDYLRVMGIPLLRGRAFDERDRAGAPNVMIVNETMARRHFPDDDPIGRRVAFPWGGWREVVGVVGDVRDRGLEEEPRAEMYVPLRQEAFGAMVLVVRTTGDPRQVIDGVKRQVYAIDADQPVHSVATMDELVSQSLAERRFSLVLFGVFGGLATALAAIGIYGVVSYGVTGRTREIGVRVALGARRGDVVRLVLRHGFALAAVGTAIGVAVALASTRAMASLLFEVSASDPITITVVALGLLGIALLATYFPARRATRVHPMEALRND